MNWQALNKEAYNSIEFFYKLDMQADYGSFAFAFYTQPTILFQKRSQMRFMQAEYRLVIEDDFSC